MSDEMKYELGVGKLTWSGSERKSDRYGYIYLLNSGDSTTENFDPAPLEVPENIIGKYGELSALILKTRQSTHIGDIFRGIFPETPKKNSVIILGDGIFLKNNDEFQEKSFTSVGLEPVDKREHDWLNVVNLYKCHEQTVKLFFEIKDLK